MRSKIKKLDPDSLLNKKLDPDPFQRWTRIRIKKLRIKKIFGKTFHEF